MVKSLRPAFPHAHTVDALSEQFGFHVANEGAGGSVEVTGITMASGEVRDGDLFVALPGVKHHGAAFASAAVEAGARAILTDEEGAGKIALAGGSTDIPVLQTEDPRAAMAEVSAWMYRTGSWRDTDSRETIFGVTGTNGKTSVSFILAALLEQLGRHAGLSTTTSRRVGDSEVTGGLTTPESTELHALLATMREADVRDIVLEVSAQALTRHRIDAVMFDVVGFTNLSHDHLDDYGSMEVYYQAKRELFSPDRAKRGAIVVDSQWGKVLASDSRIPSVTISSNPDVQADWMLEVTSELLDETAFVLRRGDLEIATHVPLLGSYSAANAALALVMLIESGVDAELVAETVADGIQVYVPGRAEVVSEEGDPTVIIDYAHTPDAFERLIEGVRHVLSGRLIFVFGAPGSRDTSKRGEMARIAAKGADVVVVTDYNPREEDPAAIRAVLINTINEVEPSRQVIEIAEPREAIRHAIRLAHPEDIVVYAGPGHRETHEVAGVKVPFSARDEARAALAELRAER